MFGIFNNKRRSYKLDWLGVDMHSHLIAGIDDGCSTIDLSITCIQGLSELGIHTFYTTPHIFPEIHPNDAATISKGLQELNHAIELKKEAQLPSIQSAAEYMITPDFKVMDRADVFCLLPQQHILIEMSYLNESANIEQVIYELKLAGYRPILAHPERYLFYIGQSKRLQRLKEIGCLFQCNLLSYAGYYGPEVKKQAVLLAKEGVVDFLGTDLHHQRHLKNIVDFASQTNTQQIFDKCKIQNQIFAL